MNFKAVVALVAAFAAAAAAVVPEEGGEGGFVITKVDIDGNKYFKDARLRDLLRLDTGERYERYLFDYMLEQGLAAVEAAYYAEGFDAVAIRWAFRDVKEGRRKFQLRIEEGPRARITDILLEGVGRDHYLNVRDNLAVDVGSPLSARDLNEAALKIGRYYGERGYARASAQLRIDRETGVVTFTVDEGRVYHIGEIIVAGNEKTRPKIVTREIEHKIKPDRLWRGSKIDESRANIYRTGLYRDLMVEAADSERSPDLVDILVIVREDKFRWYQLEPGYESPDRASFAVGWGHNNVFGNNQKFSAEVSAAYGFATEESKFGAGVTYTEPWLFGYRYRGSATVSYERDIEAERRRWQVAVEPRVTREITDNLEVSGGFKLKRARTEYGPRGDNVTVVWPVGEGGRGERYAGGGGLSNITSVIFSSTYSTRDDVFNPLRGIYLFGSEETAGGLLPGADFWRVIADGRRYIKVAEAATVAGHLRGGYARAYGDTKDVPDVEKFVSGGAYSVRGYPERGLGPQSEDGYALGGNLFFTANVELRFQLPFTAGRRVPGVGLNLGNLWAGFFADGGNVWSDWDELKKAPLQYGTGFGLRYNTPVGPVRFDYGKPVRQRGKAGPGHLYLAFGHAF